MDREKIKVDLLAYSNSIDIIDTHEHFLAEEYHLEQNYNFYYWFMPYIQFDLFSAGMPRDMIFKAPQSEQEVDEYWNKISPIWENVKNSSYARPFRMALKEFWGIDDITDGNYKEIGELMNKTRYDGRYREILYKRCKIKYMINQTAVSCYKDDYMKGGFFPLNINYADDLKENKHLTFDEYLDMKNEKIKEAKANGAVLIKFDSSCFITKFTKETAQKDYDISMETGIFNYNGEFAAFMFDNMIDMAAEAGLVIAVHTGVWYNINQKNPELLFPVVERHPNAVFDIYHMGMPYVRECGFLGKNYQNVYLNMCWSHIVSDTMTKNAMSEWLDYVPINKIFAFGGDFATMPENIWAHLQIAKDNICEVLTDKIIEGKFDLKYAKLIIYKWFYENPARVYGLL